MERFAQPNQPDNTTVGANTPLHLATQVNMRQAVINLMNCGGDPEIINGAGFTCLHIAAREGHIDLVKHFIAMDVNLDKPDEYGYSAAYWAHRHKHSDIVALLPPPKKITKEDYYEFITQQVWPNHPDVMKGGKKKKKKKGGKKKK